MLRFLLQRPSLSKVEVEIRRRPGMFAGAAFSLHVIDDPTLAQRIRLMLHCNIYLLCRVL